MILVFVETDASGATEVSLEAVTFARSLSAAGNGVPIDAVIVGEPAADLATVVEALGSYGVRRVHHVTGDGFTAYSGAAWAHAVQGVRETARSVVVMAAGTPRGMEVLAHLSARQGVAMAANVTSFGGLSPFVVTRQVVGGAALEEMSLDQRPAVFTVAGHAVEPTPSDQPVSAELVETSPEVPAADLRAQVVSSDPAPPDEAGGLKSAKVVVGPRRGGGAPEGLCEQVEGTHGRGGALGVSRGVTSLGWRPHHEQVGQTGVRISPELYIPCGISGAIQHWAGCSSAKTILAINTDAEAPMVTKASYAVIGDLHEVVPAINAEIRRRRGSRA
jgi:electron transfer flavoprotein alpha subunit